MNKKIKRLATTTIICVLVASIFGSVMVFAPPPDFIFPELIDVFVTNTSDDPVPVEVTDDTLDVNLDEPIEVINTPDFEPVQFSGYLEIPDGSLAGGVTYFFEVPEGKMLVIEYISAQASNINVSDSLSVDVVTTVNGEHVFHWLGLVEPQGRSKIDPDSDPYQYLSKEVKIYADPETEVSVGAERLTRLNEVDIVISMSGYFMEVS